MSSPQTRARRVARRHLHRSNNDLGRFVTLLGQSRRRPITLCPLSQDLGPVSALWLAQPNADLILYREALPDPTTAIAHELGHMLLEHAPIALDLTLEATEAFPSTVSSRARLRHDHSSTEESDAEHLATLIALQLDGWTPDQTVLTRLL